MMHTIVMIGLSLYRGYLKDGVLGSEFSYLKGYHDYQVDLRKGTQRRRRKSMNVQEMSTHFLAKMIYTEKVKAVVTSKKEETAQKIQEYLDDVLETNNYWNNTREATEVMFNTGGKVEKPIIKNGNIVIDFVTANKFYASEWDNKRVLSGQFEYTFKKNGYHYTKLTKYENKGDYYKITKRLFRSKTEMYIGDEINYNDVFSDDAVVTMQLEKSIPFTYTKPATTNNQVIGSPLGLPIWWNALDITADIDMIFDKKHEEVKYGGKKTAVPQFMMNTSIDSDGNKRSWYDDNDPTIIGLDVDPTELKGLSVNDLTTEIRHMTFIELMNHALDLYAVKIGLQAGTFRYDGKSIQTATQVISERSETFRTKKLHERNLEMGHVNLFRSIIDLANALDLDERVQSIPDDLKIEVQFDDSIIVDDDKTLEDMKADVDSGIVPPYKYLMKKYKLDDTEAKRWVEEAEGDLDFNALEGIEAADRDDT
jgi:A118 family predicted phage portal protein